LREQDGELGARVGDAVPGVYEDLPHFT
jgi:hypothetical protein